MNEEESKASDAATEMEIQRAEGGVTAWNDGMEGQARPLTAPPTVKIQKGQALSSAPEALYSGKIQWSAHHHLRDLRLGILLHHRQVAHRTPCLHDSEQNASMEGLFTPVSTTYLKPRADEPAQQHLIPVKKKPSPALKVNVDSVDDALDALRSQPDYDALSSVLKFLTSKTSKDGFNINAPGPKSAAAVQLLVTEIAPNYWALLSEDLEDKDWFLRCLRGVTGINAILSHIRVLISDSKAGRGPSGPAPAGERSLYLGIFLDLLAAILQGDHVIQSIWSSSVGRLSNEAQRRAQSQALLTLLASGKLVSLAGEASSILGREHESRDSNWIGDGSEMSRWIGQNIITWARSAAQTDDSDDQVQFCSTLFQRSLSLGYSGAPFSYQNPSDSPNKTCRTYHEACRRRAASHNVS
jgi:hypothetical protein